MKPSNETSLFPEGALPCVWMTAGLLAFKLCDREFDCENCPLDAALAQAKRDPVSHRPAAAAAASWEFPMDRSYHAGHGWIKASRRRRVRVGLDVLVSRLLDHLTAVVLPPNGSRIRQERPASWLTDESELFPMRAPLSGMVVGVNGRLQDDPGLLATSPYEEGWLLDVECESGLEQVPGLLSAEQIRLRTARQLQWLHERASRHVVAEGGIGPTLADGGERLTGLRMILGTERYHRLVRQLLETNRAI